MARFTAQELKLDYFKIYDVADQPGGYNVGLENQFGSQPEPAQLTRLHMFAAVATKDDQPVYDKHAHLNWYNVYDPVPDPLRRVAFENQFGPQEVIIGRSFALLTPAQKMEQGSKFPTQLDHYRVYHVLHGEPLIKTIRVEDQFGREDMTLYPPRFFCVPTSKSWQGHGHEVRNKEAHLVVYAIEPKLFEKTIKTSDQFSNRILQIAHSSFFAVPSLKGKWGRLD